jgi:hypothetical protein
MKLGCRRLQHVHGLRGVVMPDFPRRRPSYPWKPTAHAFTKDDQSSTACSRCANQAGLVYHVLNTTCTYGVRFCIIRGGGHNLDICCGGREIGEDKVLADELCRSCVIDLFSRHPDYWLDLTDGPQPES